MRVYVNSNDAGMGLVKRLLRTKLLATEGDRIFDLLTRGSADERIGRFEAKVRESVAFEGFIVELTNAPVPEAPAVPTHMSARSVDADEVGGESLDDAVEQILGTTLPAYDLHGYQGIKLGETLEELSAPHPLKPTNPAAPYIFQRSSFGQEDFLFDGGGRLVCYTKRYSGGADEYLPQLLEVFGKTDKEIKTSETSGPGFARARTSIQYTFQKVLAMINFVRTITPSATRDETLVSVIDRRWIEEQLLTNARGKRQAIGWLQEAVAQLPLPLAIENGRFKLQGDLALRSLPGTVSRPNLGGGGSSVMNWIDTTAEREATLDLGRQKSKRPIETYPIICATLGFSPGPSTSRNVDTVSLNLDRLSILRGTPLLGQGKFGVGGRELLNGPVMVTPYSHLAVELTMIILQEVFPASNGQVSLVPANTGFARYEWRSEEKGVLVRCWFNDSVEVIKSARKSL